MVKLTSPYNFVPLNKQVYIPSWYNEVSQDIPFEDGEDGWIEVTWKNVSPLIIKEKADKDDDESKKSVPVYVEDTDGKKRYFIPGTSMKGMLRSTLEILSFGKMEQYQREIKVKKKSVSVQNLVEKEQKPVEGKDLCEIIFGFTGKDASLRGRVQVSHAFCTDAPDGKELLDEKYGVLGEPKPSFYQLYLKQTGPEYKTFNDAEGIAGRKLYRVHAGARVLSLPKGNGNKKTESSFRPLKVGLTFVMRINLHNMRPVEIGAILSALTLHNTKGAWHNMGSAKSFGYGKIDCVEVKLERLKHDKAYYMRAFEEEMECFTRKELSQKWRETEQTTMLVNILSEHSNDDVRMMTLEEYGDVSKNTSFQKLKEGEKRIASSLPAYFERIFRDKEFCAKNKEMYDRAKARWDGGKLDEAKNIYDDIILLRLQSGLDTDDEDAKKKEIEDKIHELAEQKAKRQQEIDAANQAERLAKGLKAMLEEKYPNGRYKRDTVKKALDIAEQRLKRTHKPELSEEEKQDLYSTLERLKSCPSKEDRKLWGNPMDRTWVRIERMIGDELTNKLRL